MSGSKSNDDSGAFCLPGDAEPTWPVGLLMTGEGRYTLANNGDLYRGRARRGSPIGRVIGSVSTMVDNPFAGFRVNGFNERLVPAPYLKGIGFRTDFAHYSHLVVRPRVRLEGCEGHMNLVIPVQIPETVGS